MKVCCLIRKYKELSFQYKIHSISCVSDLSDFAYPTVKDRLPVILTKVVDTVYRMKKEILKTHGEEGVEDLKSIVGHLSRLKNELQTDKPLSALEDDREDTALWNRYLDADREVQLLDGGRCSSWFQSSWLSVECYFYRRVFSAISLSSQLKMLDPFQGQKENAFLESFPAILTLASYLNRNIFSPVVELTENRDLFLQLLQVALWGNKCDLSISAGTGNSQTSNPLAQLDSLKPHLLQDDSDYIWRHLVSLNRTTADSRVQLSIVLDNAGFELFTDLCLADFLVARKLVDVVHFYAKSMPWFVSDVTLDDWNWTLESLSASEDQDAADVGKRWKSRVEDGSWRLHVHPFWTLPHDFQSMNSVAPDLHRSLAESSLIIFKGDLNYRKLFSDRKWSSTTSASDAAQNFRPAPLCTLRTLKSDVVVGLAEGQADKLEAENSDWMLTGTYAVIQFLSSL